MKTLIACYLLSTIALTYANYPIMSVLPITYKELIEELINKATDVSAEVESDDDDITDLQGMFSLLEQIEMEKAKQMQDDEDGAKAQFWAALGPVLWKAGKGYLKNRYCNQEAEVRAMIEELVDEQETSETNEVAEEENNNRFTELKNLVNTLNYMGKKRFLQIIDGDVVKIEGWFKKLRKSLKKKAKKLARKVLC